MMSVMAVTPTLDIVVIVVLVVELIHKQTIAIQTRLNKPEVPIIQSLIKSSI